MGTLRVITGSLRGYHGVITGVLRGDIKTHTNSNIELLHRPYFPRPYFPRPYFPRRSRLKFGQYAPNGCVVTILVVIGTKVARPLHIKCISSFRICTKVN